MSVLSGRRWTGFLAGLRRRIRVLSQPRSGTAQVCRFFSGRPEKISVVGGSNGEKGTHLSCASIGGDYSKAKGSSWDMGGATGGGRDGIPRWSGILRVICGG